MRKQIATEKVTVSGNITQYFDELGRNTYYYNKYTKKWVDKLWIRLPNGQDREVLVKSSTGYWRKHFYDVFTGVLEREVDSYGNKNLVNKRQEWNKADTILSVEVNQHSQSGANKRNNATELF